MQPKLFRLIVTFVVASALSLGLINLHFTIKQGQNDVIIDRIQDGGAHGKSKRSQFERKVTRPPFTDGNEASRDIMLNAVTATVQDLSARPWFMKDGRQRPKSAKISDRTRNREIGLWPEDQANDRIVAQLMYGKPDGQADINTNVSIGTQQHLKTNKEKLKIIYLNNGKDGFYGLQEGRHHLLQDKCPVNTCTITTDKNQATIADMVLFREQYSTPAHIRNINQVWMIFMLESPHHTQVIPNKHLFNWTATYRSDSDIVTPYEKFVPYDILTTYNSQYNNTDRDVQLSQQPIRPLRKNYAKGKTKQVAWFVSNCNAKNNRLQYANELGLHIQVDIYGSCGTHKCSRLKAKECFDLLDTDYRFYLAFENSNCADYITEKYFVNGLGHDVIPIVMGARKDDYIKASPPNSFIHVDDFPSPRELASYLIELSENETAYNEYLRWKGSGEFINTFFWCRICAMLHHRELIQTFKSYVDYDLWWRGPGVCRTGSWKK